MAKKIFYSVLIIAIVVSSAIFFFLCGSFLHTNIMKSPQVSAPMQAPGTVPIPSAPAIAQSQAKAMYSTYVDIPLKYMKMIIKWFTFQKDEELREWEEKVFKGKVIYTIDRGESLAFVHAKSEGAASALYYKTKLDARKMRPVVSWKWRVEKFPVKKSPESLDSGAEDDFAGRVYIIFPAKFITNWKVLEYIWAETLPIGTKGVSSLSKNIKLLVLRSGKPKEGELAVEERDIVADYTLLFGKPPEYDIGAVAFMTNSENTKTSADAMYSDIKLGYMENSVSNKKGGNFESKMAKN